MASRNPKRRTAPGPWGLGWSRCRLVSWPVVMIIAGFEPGRLLALKFRMPLFEKRSNSFVAVLRQVTTNLFLDLIVESVGKFFCMTGKQRLLHPANGQQRTSS